MPFRDFFTSLDVVFEGVLLGKFYKGRLDLKWGSRECVKFSVL